MTSKRTVSVAFTSAVFLIAAHIALVRFEPMLSSRAMADTINASLACPIAFPRSSQKATLILYGDQSYGSSIPFYTHRPVLLVNGRVAAMLWGSNYPDAPHIFLNDQDLLARWGTGPRNFLFVPVDHRAHVASLSAAEAICCRNSPEKLSTPIARSRRAGNAASPPKGAPAG